MYGEPRLTKNIDIIMDVGRDELGRVLEVLKKAGLETIVPDPEDFVEKTMVLPSRDKDSGFRVDLIFSDSAYEKEAFARSKKLKVGDTHVSFISPEDLVIHKVIAGRPRDIEDAKSVLINNPSLDREYIRGWLARLDESLAADYLETFLKLERDL